LLDDPLSACDASTGKAIFDHCIKGALEGKTRILATHQVRNKIKNNYALTTNSVEQ